MGCRVVYNVQIKACSNGFMVDVGCKTVVFEDLERMIGELRRYYADPDVVEKEYLGKERYRTANGCDQPTPPVCEANVVPPATGTSACDAGGRQWR